MTSEKFHFWGRVGRDNAPPGRVRTADGPTPTWRYDAQDFALEVSGKYSPTIAAWQDPADRPTRPSVFVAGSLYLGSDGEFGESTSVEPLALESAPEVIARSFEIHGTRAFALLDGDFSLVLFDPKSKTVYLVVDKLGCSDIYLRCEGNSVLFASQPSDLFDDSEPFDPILASFLLAQLGFIPSPFTLSNQVKAIGRSKFARISWSALKLRYDVESYWSPEGRWELPSVAASGEKFFTLLRDAVEVRLGARSCILLSGGVDSSLILNLTASSPRDRLVALTGSIAGWSQGEDEIACARSIAADLSVRHEVEVLDPMDETLPEELVDCTISWMNGSRLTLPLWHRFARHLRELLGEGYHVINGQMADTMSDNCYTAETHGYRIRRAMFSAWLLRIIPLLRVVAPHSASAMGRLLFSSTRSVAGPKIARMVESVLNGLSNTASFYAGRVFGYGEMPGVSSSYFPMLTPEGFDRVVDWYSSNFVRPHVENLNSANFYRNMIEMSLDMNHLHLDSRLVFHSYRQEGGRAQLPFTDARIVTFFADLPYSARAFYREPKHIIRRQLRREGMKYRPRPSEHRNSTPSKSQEQVLLEGTLGNYYRDLLRQPTFPNRAPGLFQFVDEQYFERQVSAFDKGEEGVDHGFISKIGTLEVWSRALYSRRKDQPTLVAQ